MHSLQNEKRLEIMQGIRIEANIKKTSEMIDRKLSSTLYGVHWIVAFFVCIVLCLTLNVMSFQKGDHYAGLARVYDY